MHIALWIVCILALVAGFDYRSCHGQQPGEKPAWQPILDRPLADPFVYREGDYWYIFGTAHYCYVGRELTADHMKRVKLHLDLGETSRWRHPIWGFKVYKHVDGTYHAHVTLLRGRFLTEIAHLVPAPGQVWQSGRPITRWKLDKILIPYRGRNNPIAYDQKLVRDEDGTLYLIYNTASGWQTDVHIMAQRMLDPGTIDGSFKPRRILSPEGYRSEDRNPNFVQIVEGTNVAKLGGKHVLIYSVGDFAFQGGSKNNYKIGLAYCDRLIPPEGKTYQKILIRDPENVWNNDGKRHEVRYLLQSQIEAWPNYCGRLLQGPGIGNIIATDGDYWLIFHGYRPDAARWKGSGREVWKLPLRVQISDDRPMADWIRVGLPE